VRLLYNLLSYLALIPYAGLIVFRSVVNRAYRENLGQRFGFGYPEIAASVWVHAVSVGEVQAALPLIKALKERYPAKRLLVTTVTPTGAARVKAAFGDGVEHSYIPFEFPYAIKRFFASVNPAAALIMETEIWPNLYRACDDRDIPLILVSARISPRSVPNYKRLLPLIRKTLSYGIIIAAQSQSDADRFLALGAAPERTTVMGNIKFDVELPEGTREAGIRLRKETIGDRPVWIAASTHRGEERQVLDAHRALLERHADLLLILVPRHPERFADIRQLVEKRGFDVISRSEGRACAASTQVLLGDTMGEMPLFFAASDVAFIAGSLMPIGGHNLLEPAAQGLPIITGPHNFNAQEIADLFVELRACRLVKDWQELATSVGELLGRPDRRAELGNNALALLQQNRGALARLLVLLDPLLDERQGA